MSSDVLCVRAEVDLDSARSILVERQISGVPVVDALGRPVGTLTRADLLREAHDASESASLEGSHRPDPASAIEPGMRVTAEPRTVGDVMTPLAISLPERASIARASALMASERIHRLPLVDHDGAVVGVISTLDVARWIAEQNGYVFSHRTHARR
jgi:CBS domain-containing protein